MKQSFQNFEWIAAGSYSNHSLDSSMGINYPDIRKVIYFGIPGTVEEYMQESGRAGRDHNPATACILYGISPKVQQSK